MSRFFASPADPWFRIGRLDVGSVMFVVLLTGASWLAWVIAPSLPQALALSSDALFAGQVWRLVTWPLASGPSLLGLITLFLFYYFGIELEQMLGARKMAGFLVGIWASLTGVFLLVSLAAPGGLAGLRPIEVVVLLMWIAEYPRRKFLFNIPAWVFGIILLALEVMDFMAARSLPGLVSFVLSLLLVAVIARRLGMLSELAWIPGRPSQRRPPRTPKVKRTEVRQQRKRVSAQERIDELLDKISEHGLNSLTEAEKRELLKLRESRRQP